MEADDPTKIFSGKEMCYYKMVNKYFKKCPNFEVLKMLSIINGTSNISLRVLDWFITRYSKKGVCFPLPDGDIFDVHISYRAQLKSYKKIFFDPFRRHKKFYYKIVLDSNTYIIKTTVGQLIFFKWAFENKIIEYVEKELDTIIKAMIISNKEDKQRKMRTETQSNNSSIDYNSVEEEKVSFTLEFN